LIAVFLAFFWPGIAFAQAAGAVPAESVTLPALFWVLNVATLILGLVATVMWIFKSSRPTPPLHKQFADMIHTHPDYVTRPELSEAVQKISRDVDKKLEESARRDERFDVKLDGISSKLSDGFSHVHKRIDPMAEALAATSKALEVHMSDHRREARHGN
jgi:hypothetical protein